MRRVLLCNENRGFGGGEVATLALARALRPHGWESTLMCRPGSWLDEAAGDGLERLYAPFASELDLVTTARAASALRHVDIAHVHAGRDHLLVGLAAAWRRVPVVRTLHSFLETSMSGLYRRILTRHTHAVICVSNALRQQALEYGVPAERAVVVANGVDIAHFQPQPPAQARRSFGVSDDAVVIGVVSGLWTLKGPDLALQVIARVPGVRALIAGDGPMREELEALAASLGIGDRVRFLGKLDDPRPVYAASDLVLMASRQDAFPLVALEAQACGRPLVAFGVGGLPETVAEGDTALLAPPGDVAALAQRLRELASDLPRARRMGEAALRHIQAGYSEDVMAERLSKVYEGACATSGSRGVASSRP